MLDQLAGVRKISTNNSKELLKRFGSLQRIILHKSYDEFKEIDGIADAKVDALVHCFKNQFKFK